MVEIPAFGSNPGALRMWLATPAALGPRAPLVVVLHGCGQTAEGYAEGAGWLTLAERCGFAVLAPEQTRANNANLCFNWFQPVDIGRVGGEAESIRQMVARALALHDLDPARVFVTGLSAGGAMTAVMLATAPELFAAGAVIAGLPYGAAGNLQEALAAMMSPTPPKPGRDLGDRVRAATPHAGRWPALSVWHGGSDTTVRPAAGEDLVRQWLDLHGLDRPDETEMAPGRIDRIWRSAAGAPLVEQHILPALGHGTPLKTFGPDGCGAAGPFLLEVGVSSSREIAQSWGLEPVRREQNHVEPPRAEPLKVPPIWETLAARSAPRAEPRIDPRRKSGRTTGAGIGAVIERTLRSAGLLK
jgi:feruloyl esterase